MIGAIPTLPQYALMVWCIVKAQGLFYLYLTSWVTISSQKRLCSMEIVVSHILRILIHMLNVIRRLLWFTLTEYRFHFIIFLLNVFFLFINISILILCGLQICISVVRYMLSQLKWLRSNPLELLMYLPMHLNFVTFSKGLWWTDGSLCWMLVTCMYAYVIPRFIWKEILIPLLVCIINSCYSM